MRFGRQFLGFFFPPRCIFCDSPREEEDWTPCPRCQGSELWCREGQGVLPGQHFSRCVCAGWYEGALRDSVQRFKFLNHPEYARAYGPLLAKRIRLCISGAFDLITWMPVSPQRLEERGYDQARLLAEETAAALGMGATPLLEKVRDTPPQSSLAHGAERWRNAAGAYRVGNPAPLQGKVVLVVDDIITTGATLEEGAAALKQAGAAGVCAAAFCRPPAKGIRNP